MSCELDGDLEKFAPNVFKDKIPFVIDVRESEKTRKVRSSRMLISLAGLYLRCLAGGGRVQVLQGQTLMPSVGNLQSNL